MKKRLLQIAFIVITFTCTCSLHAQTREKQNKVPGWLSDKGYWVIESNTHTPKSYIVYFYTKDHILAYQENIQNQKLKLNRSRTLYHLKAVLEESVGNLEKGTLANRKDLLAHRMTQ